MEHLREIDLIPFRGLVICLSLRIVLTFGALEGVFQICSRHLKMVYFCLFLESNAFISTAT